MAAGERTTDGSMQRSSEFDVSFCVFLRLGYGWGHEVAWGSFMWTRV
jgi:hypothetical protein